MIQTEKGILYMKKSLFCRLLSVSLAVLMLLSAAVTLTACGETETEVETSPEDLAEPERAAELIRRFAKADEASTGGVAVMDATITMRVNNLDMTVTIKSKTQHSEKDGQLREYNSVDTTVSAPSAKINERIRSYEGYMDGFMFYMNGKARLYSELSQEDYRAWSEDRHAATGGDIMDAVTLAAASSTRTCTEDETGYIVTLSGLDQAVLEAMDSLTKSLQELDSGVRMTDATITAVLDKTTYLASSIEVTPVFITDTANANAPTMTCTCTITDWNNATVETVDPTTLTKCDNLRLLYALKDQYDAMDEALTGSYKGTIKNVVKIAGQTQSTEETDEATFSRQDGELTFTINAKMNKDAYVITYIDGKQTVNVNGKNNGYEVKSQPTAEAFLTGQYDPLSFDLNMVESMNRDPDGSFTITFNNNALKSYKETYEQSGYTFLNGSGSVTVTLKENGRLDSCVYHIALRYSITQGNQTFIGTQVIDTTLEFGDYVLPDTATDVETN